jgi:hypothetical protein
MIEERPVRPNFATSPLSACSLRADSRGRRQSRTSKINLTWQLFGNTRDLPRDCGPSWPSGAMQLRVIHHLRRTGWQH